ncbi:MAG: hypothetical protein R3A52_11650 [Polyangiales bacterium]
MLRALHAPLWPMPPWRALPTMMGELRPHRVARSGGTDPLSDRRMLGVEGPWVPCLGPALLAEWHAGHAPRGRFVALRGSPAEVHDLGRALIDAFARDPRTGAFALHRLRGTAPSAEQVARAKIDVWGVYCGAVAPDEVDAWLRPSERVTLVLGAEALDHRARAERAGVARARRALDGCAGSATSAETRSIWRWEAARGRRARLDRAARAASPVAEWGARLARGRARPGRSRWRRRSAHASTGRGSRHLDLRAAWVDVDALASVEPLRSLVAEGRLWSVASLRALRALSLDHEPEVVDSLGDLPRLERYRVLLASRAGLAAVSRNPRLRDLTLDLRDPTLALDDVPALPGLRALRVLTYGRPPLDLAPLARCARLRSLNVFNAEVTSAEVALSLRLDALAIENVALDLVRLAEHPTLRALAVGVDTPALRELRRRRPDLDVTVYRPWYTEE